MYTHDTKIRVRYSETDQMGYVYNGNYAQYYEVGRVEMLRSLGMTYGKMEESGGMLPLLELKCKFIKPALYDQELPSKHYLGYVLYSIMSCSTKTKNSSTSDLRHSYSLTWTKRNPVPLPTILWKGSQNIITRFNE